MMYRGFLLDVARCLQSRAYYRRAIDFMAARGCNVLLWHFTDDQGCMFDFRSVPGLASPNAYSRAEMTDLIRYAADRGIEIVPEIASLGHSRYISRLPAYRHLNEDDSPYSGICPVSPITRDVTRRLIEETCDVFQSPNVHVGLDEVNFGAHPETAAAMRTRTKGELFVDFIHFAQQIVEARGRRMWMWADGVTSDRSVLAAVSRRIVQCNWDYHAEVPTTTTQQLLDAGFDVLIVPALISHYQTLLPGDRNAFSNVASMKRHAQLSGAGRILGTVTSTWMPMRTLSDAQWLAMDLAARSMRDDDTDPPTAIAEFGRAFYGLSATAKWAEVAGEILRLAPVRREWMQVAKHDDATSLSRAELSARASDWRRIARELRALQPMVSKHRQAFGAFRLTVALLAHAYDATSRLAAVENIDPATLRRLTLRGQRLLQRVERQWDRERFADDVVKHTPAWEVFRDDHLILILQDGLRKLETLAEPVELV